MKMTPLLLGVLLATALPLALPLYAQDTQADTRPTIGVAGQWPIVGDGDDSPSAVRAVQYLLRAQGFAILVDGRFGDATREQVWKYQLNHDIATTYESAIVDGRTWENLTPDLKRGARGAAVRALQCLLRSRGYKVALDGNFGPQTEKAVRSFQKAHYIEFSMNGYLVPGTVEQYTWCELVGGISSQPEPGN